MQKKSKFLSLIPLNNASYSRKLISKSSNDNYSSFKVPSSQKNSLRSLYMPPMLTQAKRLDLGFCGKRATIENNHKVDQWSSERSHEEGKKNRRSSPLVVHREKESPSVRYLSVEEDEARAARAARAALVLFCLGRRVRRQKNARLRGKKNGGSGAAVGLGFWRRWCVLAVELDGKKGRKMKEGGCHEQEKGKTKKGRVNGKLWFFLFAGGHEIKNKIVLGWERRCKQEKKLEVFLGKETEGVFG
ncbi:unnamed protein product [Lactuca saligna]|uniref:Uncharacterized protein n=1 Tax=Lactuca saligna TaxID=75948 RepID=A0AA35ZLT0_LACSI|nr:unnamed protein product [Lactuca saligna]